MLLCVQIQYVWALLGTSVCRRYESSQNQECHEYLILVSKTDSRGVWFSQHLYKQKLFISQLQEAFSPDIGGFSLTSLLP